MWSLYSLITRTNLKSPTIAFPLIMPLIFVLLYSVGIDSNLDKVAIDALVAGFFTTILCVQTMQSGLMGFGINFIAIKKSVLLKRIGATELTKTQVIMALLFYGLTLWVISVVWIFLVMILFSSIGLFYSVDGATGNHVTSSVISWVSNVNWGKLTLATIVTLYASYGLGLFFTSVAKDDQSYMGMAMLYFFFAGFVGGIMFPPTATMPEWMIDFGYIIPHSYVGYLYDWTANYEVENWRLILGVVIPIIFGTLITIVGIKVLKFD